MIVWPAFLGVWLARGRPASPWELTTTVNGSLRGNVVATERIELHPKARVLADLTTPNLAIQEGAFFQGSCKMGETPSNVIGMPTAAVDRHS